MATQSTRDKMRLDGKRQLNFWVSSATAAHLKSLRERTGKPYPLLLADALAALETALSGEPAEPEPSPAPSADNELLQRLAALEAGSSAWVAGHEQNAFEIDLLKHWKRDFEGRLSALEARSAAQSPEPLLTPSPEPETAISAGSVAVAAVPGAQSTDVSDTGSTASSSSETNPADNVLAAADIQNEKPAPGSVSPELAALIAAIPEAEFLGLNGERNRRIIELHKEGLGTSAISRRLMACGIPSSAEPSISYFLKKHGIPANKPGRADKK